MQDIRCDSELSELEPAAARPGSRPYAALERLRAWLRAARSDVAWTPLVARALATAIALLGLAGIGLAASRSPELSMLTRAPVAAGFAQLAGVDLSAALGKGGAAASARPAAVAGASGTAAGNGAELPCPRSAVASSADPGQPTAADDTRAAAPASSRRKGSGLVILNRADASEFQRLPGVGAKRALAIVELRQRLGRFRRPSDLLRVKGIGPKTLERMLPQLALDAAP